MVDLKFNAFYFQIMDPLTNRLYVGAVNNLYDLSPVDLSIREHAVTGPKKDSIFCAGKKIFWV